MLAENDRSFTSRILDPLLLKPFSLFERSIQSLNIFGNQVGELLAQYSQFWQPLDFVSGDEEIELISRFLQQVINFRKLWFRNLLLLLLNFFGQLPQISVIKCFQLFLILHSMDEYLLFNDGNLHIEFDFCN